MKLITLVSPSHAPLYEEFFSPTVPPEFELVAKVFIQDGSGNYKDGVGWLRTMDRKLELIIRHIRMGEPFVYADIDIQFFKPKPGIPAISDDILTHLMHHNLDLVFQCDLWARRTMCFGFFGCYPSQQVLNLMHEVRRQCTVREGDQEVLNRVLQHQVKWGLLPPRYWTHGAGLDREWPCPESSISPPEDIVMHHGNWTRGVENKINLMRLVRSKVTP